MALLRSGHRCYRPLFKSVINPYLIEKFRVVRVPTVVEIDKDTGLWRVVSLGLTLVDLIKKRIFEFAYDLGIIREGIYEGFEELKLPAISQGK